MAPPNDTGGPATLRADEEPPVIDLRSDTVTTPTPAMRRAMAEAEVGDDVYREDPTVRALEERAAELAGKEAALFTSSGTLANQLALKVWTEPGDQVVLDARSHYLQFEPASMALISGVVARPVDSERGWFGPAEVAERLAAPAYGTVRTSLVCVENTHNRAGGAVYPEAVLDELARFCRERSLPLHMDGARLFNAAVASGRSAARVAAPADSVSFCLSKGLGCPVGSLLCGPGDFIEETRTVRQVLGGGMRQAGVLAAAGIYALENNVARLAEDHDNAERLENGLKDLGLPVERYTNMVFLHVGARAEALAAHLGRAGILVLPRPTLRLVTHLDVDAAGIVRALSAIRVFFSSR
jgi:threonine aldolase